VSSKDARSTTLIAAGAWICSSGVRVPVTTTSGSGTTWVSGTAAAATSIETARAIIGVRPAAWE
jgi:hypothetical protein